MGAFDKDTVATPATTTASAVPVANDPYFGGKSKTVTINGKQITGIDPTTGKPPAAGGIGSISPSSGLAITGLERDKAQEAAAIAMGITPEYLASRGGVNSQGYYNDTPTINQLTAEERKQVTLPNGTMNTGAILSILEKKQKDFYYKEAYDKYRTENPGWTEENVISSATESAKRAYAKYELNDPNWRNANINGQSGSQPGGYDAQGNPVAGGLYTATGELATSSTSTSASGVSNERRDAFAIITTTLKSYGFTNSEMTEINKFLEGTLTDPSIGPNQALLNMRQLNSYKARFAGNDARVKAGLNALSEADYLRQEKDYHEYMKAYGVPELGSRAEYAALIGGDVSPTEVSKRLDLAVNRVKNSDPEIAKQLQAYYNISNKDMVMYMLKPAEMLPELERKVTTAEIGTAAKEQGLAFDANRAEGLAAYGINRGQAIQGYGNIGEVLPTAQKLGDIYSESGVQYDQTSGESEFFKADAGAAQKRKQLKSMERASFSGGSGINTQANPFGKTTPGSF